MFFLFYPDCKDFKINTVFLLILNSIVFVSECQIFREPYCILFLIREDV